MFINTSVTGAKTRPDMQLALGGQGKAVPESNCMTEQSLKSISDQITKRVRQRLEDQKAMSPSPVVESVIARPSTNQVIILQSYKVANINLNCTSY